MYTSYRTYCLLNVRTAFGKVGKYILGQVLAGSNILSQVRTIDGGIMINKYFVFHICTEIIVRNKF